ncbi:MAG: polymerase subunit chi [Betaproteobacteria bacterium]|jgi:DNA polymerase-3 subunit chi|nr:polymerase subunit chi [Betaproteobacteria bacterium]
MTGIDFYFNTGDRLQVACRLAAKAAGQNMRMVIYAPEGDTASRIDKLLWTWQATGFVPHCAPHDAIAAETPVLIAAGEETPEGFGVLLNLSAECPPHFERFERLCELVGRDEDEVKAGRDRYRHYRDRGYRITNHDLANE